MSNTREAVIRVVSEVSGVSPNDVTDDKMLSNDLGLDSLDMVEITMELEDLLHVEIPDMEYDTMTVGGLVEVLDKLRQGVVK